MIADLCDKACETKKFAWLGSVKHGKVQPVEKRAKKHPVLSVSQDKQLYKLLSGAAGHRL